MLRLNVLNGLLYIRIKSFTGVDVFQFVVTNSLKARLLDSVHSICHQGRNRMLQILRTRCFWTGVPADVERFVSGAVGVM